MAIKSNKQSINHEEITCVGPPPKPDLYCMNESYKFHYSELRKIRSCLLKSRGAEDCLKARAELKLFGRKLDF